MGLEALGAGGGRGGDGTARRARASRMGHFRGVGVCVGFSCSAPTFACPFLYPAPSPVAVRCSPRLPPRPAGRLHKCTTS